MGEVESSGSGFTTRRGVLAAAVGAAAAVVVSGAAAQPALAADGDTLVLGVTNEATNTTRLETKETSLHAVSSTDDASLVGESRSSDGYGLRGTSPFIGVNAVGGAFGVYTVSDYGTAVQALTYDGTAVEASTAVPRGTRCGYRARSRSPEVGGRRFARARTGSRSALPTCARGPASLPRSSRTAQVSAWRPPCPIRRPARCCWCWPNGSPATPSSPGSPWTNTCNRA